MAGDSEKVRARAEAQFAKQQRAMDGEKARQEYEASGQAETDKTARLRALRLAKEAADTEAAAVKKAATPAKKATRRAKSSTSTR